MEQKKNFIVDNYLYIIFIYFTIFLLSRVIIGNALERDEAEQLLLSSTMQLGYSTQPPLYTWIQSIFFKLFNNPILSLSLFKNMLLFFIYFLTHKTTLILSKNRTTAVIAASSLLLIPSFSWEYQRDLTHSVLVTFFSMLLLFLIVILREKKASTLDYGILGVVAALGILSKYSFILLIATILVVSIYDSKLRSLIFNKNIFISIFVSLLTISPHSYWVFTHFNTATADTLHKMQINSNFNIIQSIKVLFFAIVELLALYLALFFIFFHNIINLNKEPFLKKYIIALTIILIIVVTAFKMQNFRGRWIVPFFLPITIYMASTLETIDAKRVRYWLNLTIFVMIGFLTAFTIRYTNPDIAKKPSRFNYPARKIYNYLNKHKIRFDTVLYGSNLVGANLKLYKPDANYIHLDKNSLNKYRNRKHILIIIDQDSIHQKSLLTKNGIKLKELRFNYKNSKKLYKIYIYSTQTR